MKKCAVRYHTPTGQEASTHPRALRIACYQRGRDYLLTEANTYWNGLQVPLASALQANGPALELVGSPEEADFILFPEYLDALLDNVGLEGARAFLRALPLFNAYPERHIFYAHHDNCLPFRLPSVFFQTSINRFDRDARAFAIPYPAQWMQDIVPDFDFSRLRYLTSFNGNIASTPIRGELVLAVQQEQRLSVYADPVAGFHCHTASKEQQEQRRRRFLETLADSLTVLCPRGEGLNSIRFYETMAAGRIPVLVSDTCLLPYEEQIDYSGFCLKLAEQDIPQAGRILADWIVATGSNRLFEMCRQARTTWERYFSQSATLQHCIAILTRLRDQPEQPSSAPSTPLVTTAAEAMLDQAIALHEQGDYATAAELYGRLLRLQPNDPQLCYLRGTLALQTKQYDEAVSWLQSAVNGAPDKADYRIHLAIARHKQGAGQTAEGLLREVLTTSPANSVAWLNLGIILHERHCLDQAYDCFRKAESLTPHDPRPPHNAAIVCQALGRLDEAERLFIRAQILAPDNGTTHWNLALLRLLQDDYPRGFADFAARFRKTDPVSRRHTDLAAWDGVRTHCRLLVWAEQGLGDTIQFVRYLRLLADRGISVVLEVHDRTLRELCATTPGAEQVITLGDQLPPVDCQVALLDLPHLLGTILATIPARTPYLVAPPDKRRTWQQRLPQGKPLVGLVWRGNPRHINDANRSCPLELLLELTSRQTDCTFLSLQWQPTPAETELLQRHGVVDMTDGLAQLDDTAALLDNLDLLITVDTSVAHLAGALDRPVWLLLPFAPDWRWGLKRTTSPWYPSLRLFRQPAVQDWSSVISQVAAELATLKLRPSTAPTVAQLMEQAALACADEAWDKALDTYGAALGVEPDNIAALLGMGGALYFSNRRQEAAEVYRRAIQLQPDNIDAHVNLGMNLLALAAYDEGWRELEWRVKRVAHLLPPIPLLTPDDLRRGLRQKTVLLHTEQGYGDTLQFIRYAALLADAGATCILTAQAEIGELLASCPGVNAVIPHGELLPRADFQALLQSLPYICSTDATSLPTRLPYLTADPVRLATYLNATGHQGQLKIGLCWQGRQLGKSGYNRSVPLEELSPLFTAPGCTWYSLQVEHQASLPAALSMPMPALQTFSDTAAFISTLDLVITIDTSVAHLAGALGKPTWVLLLWSADWRWLTARKDSPWYPSLRLFRQKQPGDWGGALLEISQELAELTTNVGRSCP